MNVLTYLQSNTLDDLSREFFIRRTDHPTLPLSILNYHQIDSQKTHPVVRDCRSLVVNSLTRELVSRSFRRFYNWGEHQEEMKAFDWSNFRAFTKEDGSLIQIFNFEGEWVIATRNSFGQGNVGDLQQSWEDLVLEALNLEKKEDLSKILVQGYTYVFELCTPYNQVVRYYNGLHIYLLSIFYRSVEMPWELVAAVADKYGLRTPDVYSFSSYEQIAKWITEKSASDKTFEGFVIRDIYNTRYKIKSSTYLALHRLTNGNLYNPANIVPLVLTGEVDEVLNYFPGLADVVKNVKYTLDAEWKNLENVYHTVCEIYSQKDFALTIIPQTRFHHLFFSCRKEKGPDFTIDDLREKWINSTDLIVKGIEWNLLSNQSEALSAHSVV